MEEYKGFACDQYGTVYEMENGAWVCCGKLINETLEEWVEDYFERD